MIKSRNTVDFLCYKGEGYLALLEELEQEAKARREAFRQEKAANPMLQMKAFAKSLRPYFILCDTVQDICEGLKTIKQETKADVLAECVEAGMYAAATTDTKLRARENKFTQMISEAKSGLVLGDIREQTVFPYTGIRESNMQTDIGYVHNRGTNLKSKLIDNK